jgi:hypothetical protein
MDHGEKSLLARARACGARRVSLSPVAGEPLRLARRRDRHAVGRQTPGVRQRHQEGSPSMGKGNNSQKNDKKNKKPKQDKTKAAPKK